MTVGTEGQWNRSKKQRNIDDPTGDERELIGMSIEERRLQIENIRRQQDFQALLQRTATESGGIFDEAAGTGYTAGAFDIDNATRDSLSMLRQELAPSLGLRSTDSPVMDRGGLVARQGILAKGSLQNTLRSQALTNRLALLQGAGQLGLGLAGIGSGSTALGNLTQARVAGVDDETHGWQRNTKASYSWGAGG
jgi:hypothetical protein